MKLLFQSNLYVKLKVLSSGAVCWECDQRRNKFACKAKLHVLNDQVIKQVNDHTHVASRAVVESSKVRQEMKKRARETEETPQQIISQSVALLSEQAAVAMPPIHHIRRDIRRQRKKLVILYLYLRTKILTSLQNTIRPSETVFLKTTKLPALCHPKRFF